MKFNGNLYIDFLQVCAFLFALIFLLIAPHLICLSIILVMLMTIVYCLYNHIDYKCVSLVLQEYTYLIPLKSLFHKFLAFQNCASLQGLCLCVHPFVDTNDLQE